jgi:D-alanine--poly(phosphoribitol) ligase subunit 2
MDRQAKIIEIVKRFAKRDAAPAPEESLFDSGLLDSFALPDMVSALEEEFAIRIPDADLNPRKFDSIERIDAYVASKQ